MIAQTIALWNLALREGIAWQMHDRHRELLHCLVVVVQWWGKLFD